MNGTQNSTQADHHRILLFVDTPPGAGNVGEIVLRDIALHCGPERFHCFAVVSPEYSHQPDSRLARMGIEVHRTRHISATRHGDSKLAAIFSDLRFPFGFRSTVSYLVDRATSAARLSDARSIFVVLSNALSMVVARRVSEQTGLPLVALVWDPPDHVLRQARFSRFSRRWLLREFQRTLARCKRIAVVSESMQLAYAQLTKAPIGVLRHGRPMAARLPSPGLATEGTDFSFGFAGGLYADCAWSALLAALDTVNWQIAGRKIKLRIMTPKVVLASNSSAHVEFLGYRADSEVADILASCDANYLPQPFQPHLSELCRYSFPTKLAVYLATGRPVFVHCPAESDLGDFYSKQPFGTICRSLHPAAILASLQALISSVDHYRIACDQASRVAIEHFDIGIFHSAVDALLGQPDCPGVK